MQALFTGALGDFIGAECFITNQDKDTITTLLWATRNRSEIQSSVDLKDIFPNLKEEVVLFDNWSDNRPTRPWEPGDDFMNIHTKVDLNRMCNLNLSEKELADINDYSLDATLQRIFQGQRWQSSRYTTRSVWPSIGQFSLPQRYVVIHPWSDAEINGREFNDSDWASIFRFLNHIGAVGVVVNRSTKAPPNHPNLINLTNKTTIKETWAIIAAAESCILCSSSLACFASKIFPKDRIWIKGGHEYIFSEWATYFYHGPFIKPNNIVFRDFKVLDNFCNMGQAQMLDQGSLTLL
jgi:hypothetical protein